MRKKIPETLTVNTVSDIFTLDLVSYDLLWKVSPSYKIKAGAIAGKISTTKEGIKYRSVRYKGKDYLAHRVVWMMLWGEDPPKEVDHEDGNGLNNHPSNLRDGTDLNSLNRRRYSNNTSGISGIRWHTQANKWQVQPQVGGRRYSLGLFSELDEALMELLEFRESHPDITIRHGMGETHLDNEKASRHE